MAAKCMSLVEQKRLQWAKEREEMAGLSAPWGPSSRLADNFRSCIRTHYMSSSQLSLGSTTDSLSMEPVPLGHPRRRSPSLPPIRPSAQERDASEEDREAQTSGYGSDCGGDSWNQRRDPRPEAGCVLHRDQGSYPSPPDSMVSAPWQLWPQCGGDEASRLRWGDRGVGVGHLWEPANSSEQMPTDCRLPQVSSSGSTTPAWLERGLSKLHHGAAQVLVIRHPPGTAGSDSLMSSGDRTYLRGQNVPLEPDILLEREQKRQKALEHQRAIQLQVEEREKRRQEEKKRILLEEQAEEERIRRVQEEERKRKEHEKQLEQERLDKEARRLRAMSEALREAERLARDQRARPGGGRDDGGPAPPDSAREQPAAAPDPSGAAPDTQTHVDTNTDTAPEAADSRVSGPSAAVPLAAVVLGAEQAPPPGVQLALLMSPASMAAPILLSPSAGCILGEAVLSSRLLTPSKYRLSARNQCTQTEAPCDRTGSGRRHRKKSASLERPHRGCKLPLRCRAQSQPKGQSPGERPKWGVNRPGRQYVKQSERDPFYQRRLRQRQHPPRSRSPSPQDKPWAEKSCHQSRRLQAVVEAPPFTPRKVSHHRQQMFVNGGSVRPPADRTRDEGPARTWPVQDILSQLSSLRQGLIMKQMEWQPSRCQTPFSNTSRS